MLKTTGKYTSLTLSSKHGRLVGLFNNGIYHQMQSDLERWKNTLHGR